MVPLRHKYLILIASFLVSIWLLIAQVQGSTLLLLPCLLCFLLLACWSAVQGMALPVLLFFLPFSPLLKTGQGATSFFTIALLGIYVISVVLGIQNVRILHLIPALCLMALTMVVKTLHGYSFDNDYILLLAALFLLPFLTKEMDGKYDYYWLTLFFTLGIALAANTAQFFVYSPNISKFIETFSVAGVTRYSGYYGDPNFYSAHITAALSGVLVLLLNEASRKRMLMLGFMAILLVYCGLMSLSKSFFLIAVCLLALWVLSLLFQKGKISAKITIILVMAVSVVFLLSFTVFTDMLDALLSRFTQNTTISDFTTGRTDIWVKYMREFARDPNLFFFGRGYSDVLIAGRAAHNTIIQSIFQLGLVGLIMLLAWFVCMAHDFMPISTVRGNRLIPILILLLGALGPWMALDLLFFDELFIIPLYVCVGIRFLTKNDAVARER